MKAKALYWLAVLGMGLLIGLAQVAKRDRSPALSHPPTEPRINEEPVSVEEPPIVVSEPELQSGS